MANPVRVRRASSLIVLLAIAGSTSVIWAQSVPGPSATVTAAATASAVTTSAAPATAVAASAANASAATASAAAAPPSPLPGTGLTPASELDPGSVRIMVGRSAILNVGSSITRVSLTSSDIADAMVTAPGQLLVNGKLPGTISMFVWDKAGALKRYEVIVQRDLSRLSDQMRELFPAENISVHSNGRNVVLSGQVNNKDLIEKAVNVATGYVDKKEEVVTLLQVQNTTPAKQVLLRVRFAEVSRSALTELGATVFTSALGINNNIGRVSTQQFPAPGFQDLSATKVGKDWADFGHPVASADGKITFSDFLNFFLFNQKYDLGIAIKALQEKGLFQSLAEPNLVAESGKDASFLAGGEFPVPIAQGSGANLAINVVFKEFGIRLNFTPTVIGDRISLKVRPEVSALDYNNAITLQGFRIPALSTRRTETELELMNKQTFAISGLLNNTVSQTLAKVPGIGDIPILGYLFKSKAAQKNQTELVVMITPEILERGSSGVTPTLPRGNQPFLEPLPEKELLPLPPEAFEGARRGVSTTPAPAAPAPSAKPASNPVAAVSALTPSATVRMADQPAQQVAPPPVPAKPLTAAEKKELERSKHDETRAKESRAQAKARADEEKRAAAQAEADKRAAGLQKEKEQKAAREQAKKDAEAQKLAEEAARRELAKQREQQRAVSEAESQLKAAQERYDSVAKSSSTK